jgi:hypothetical protein
VIRAEKASGSPRDGRTELQVLLDFVRSGDTLVVTRIDRLARSMKDLQDIVHELKAEGVAAGGRIWRRFECRATLKTHRGGASDACHAGPLSE